MKRASYPILWRVISAIVIVCIWVLADFNILPKWVGTISVALAMFATFLGILSLFSEHPWEQMKKEINQFIDYAQSSWLIWGKFNNGNGELNKFSTNKSITNELNMKRKCFIAATLVFILIFINFNFPMIFSSILVSILGIVAAIFTMEAAFVENYQEKNRKILENLCKFLMKDIYLKSLIAKNLCAIVKKLCIACDYAQYIILIDFAKEDQELAGNFKQVLKKEGIRCELISSQEKSYKTILEQNLQYYQIILIFYYSKDVPEPWLTACYTDYIRMIVRNSEVVSPAIMICTTKGRENFKKLIKAEIVYLSQPSDLEKLLNAIKIKLKNYQ